MAVTTSTVKNHQTLIKINVAIVVGQVLEAVNLAIVNQEQEVGPQVAPTLQICALQVAAVGITQHAALAAVQRQVAVPPAVIAIFAAVDIHPQDLVSVVLKPIAVLEAAQEVVVMPIALAVAQPVQALTNRVFALIAPHLEHLIAAALTKIKQRHLVVG